MQTWLHDKILSLTETFDQIGPGRSKDDGAQTHAGKWREN